MEVGDVINARIYFNMFNEWCGTDTWRFTMPEAGYVLLDVAIHPVNGVGYTCLEGDGISECAPTSWSVKHYPENTLLFRSLYAGDYTIRVVGDWSEVRATYASTMSWRSPAHSSLARQLPARLTNIGFTPGDILAWSKLNNGEERWRMFFDASDVGIRGDVTNIAAEGGSSDRLLLSLETKQMLPGVGAVTPWDVVVFDPEQLGEDTQGTFRIGLVGRGPRAVD